MKSFFIGKYEIKLPIIQGGMGVGVSLNGLASAVANEGGVGVISAAGLGLLYPEYRGSYPEKCIYGLGQEIRKAREKTYGVIGVNIMVALSNFSDMVRTAIAEKADVIFAGAGLPLDLPSYLTTDSKTQLVPIVSSSRAARLICEKWSANYGYLPDAIVVEGPKAGGHLGFKNEQIEDEHYSLEHLIPEVVEVARSYAGRKGIPVIAAGGIATGEDIARFMALGASAVQMGSIFVPTEECDASVEFKQVYLNAHREDIRIIQSPVGMPGRAFDGEFIRNVAEGKEKPRSCPFHCIKTCDYTKSPYCIIKALYNAARGNMKKGYAFAGGIFHALHGGLVVYIQNVHLNLTHIPRIIVDHFFIGIKIIMERAGDGFDLALRLGLFHHGNHVDLFQMCKGFFAQVMRQQNIEMIGLQLFQLFIQNAEEILLAIHMARRNLADDLHSFTVSAGKRFAQKAIAIAIEIHMRGIEIIHAVVCRIADHFYGFFAVDGLVSVFIYGAWQAHTAHPKGRYLKPQLAIFTILHISCPLSFFLL